MFKYWGVVEAHSIRLVSSLYETEEEALKVCFIFNVSSKKFHYLKIIEFLSNKELLEHIRNINKRYEEIKRSKRKAPWTNEELEIIKEWERVHSDG